MKQVVGLVGLAFLQLMLGCSSVAPQWRPTAVTDFKSVAGTWQGFLTSDDPKALHFDRVTLVIDDGGACETTITRTRTTMPVHYDAIHVFAEKTQLVLTDDKLSATFEKGGHMSAQLMSIQQLASVWLELRVKVVEGSPTPLISNASATLPPQNDDPLPQTRGKRRLKCIPGLALSEI
jgi:hypothetical protein